MIINGQKRFSQCGEGDNMFAIVKNFNGFEFCIRMVKLYRIYVPEYCNNKLTAFDLSDLKGKPFQLIHLTNIELSNTKYGNTIFTTLKEAKEYLNKRIKDDIQDEEESIRKAKHKINELEKCKTLLNKFGCVNE